MQSSASTSPWQPERFATALRSLRRTIGVNQATLAEWAGVGPPQISRWNAGTSRPGYDSLRQLLTMVSRVYPIEDRGFWPLLVDVAEAAGYPDMLSSQGENTSDPGPEEMVSPYSGEVWRIVRNLERRAEDAGLTEEEEREAIEAVMRRAEEAMERDLDAELYRRERDSSAE